MAEMSETEVRGGEKLNTKIIFMWLFSLVWGFNLERLGKREFLDILESF